MVMWWTALTVLLAVAAFILSKTLIIIQAREVGVKERFGKYKGRLDPGPHLLVPFIEKVRYRHDMRERVVDVPMQSCITRDNIQVTVDGDVYFQVVDPVKASYGIAGYVDGVVHLAMTTMRSEIGKLDLDAAFSERDTVNNTVVREIDEASDPWGVKVKRYEVETVQPSPNVINTLERQMEAERAKRAEITLADADRESRTNVAEGDKQYDINVSEGERQRRINEAEGRAEAISLEAEATAKAIALVANALSKPGGSQAMRLQIVERFIEEFGHVAAQAEVTIVPSDIAKIKTFFEGVDQVTSNLQDGPRQATAQAQPAQRQR
jgi:regulator of protease activity HflC (stomatin/prohibitin superfamily)